MQTVEILREPVELFKLLKFEGLAASGGEAKRMITEGMVTVNGETETRKSKKIMAGDVIGFAGHEFRVLTPATPPGTENP